MDQAFLILFVLALGAFLFVAALFGVIAFFVTRRQTREIDELRAQVERLRVAGVAAPSAPARADVEERDRAAAARAAAFTRESAPQTAPVPAPSGTPSPSAPPPQVVVPRASERHVEPLVVVSNESSAVNESSAAESSSTAPKAFVSSASSVPPRSPFEPLVDAPPPAPKASVPLEKLIGIKGAAIAAGVLLAVAGIYLFVEAVQRGWISPGVRVGMGLGFGALCVLASGFLRKRGYDAAGDALAGGGAVALYAAGWAAHHLYGLWPVGMSYGVMIATTVLCAWLSVRRSSQLVAVLGLLGGFATPFALSTGSDRPLGLFGYTLVVNLAFLSIAHKRRWPAIGMVALIGTFVVEALWIFARMRGETFWIGLLAVGVFSVVFAVFTALQPAVERTRWAASQLGALFLPFVFALYFATQPHVDVGYHLAPIAALAAVVLACGGWVARKQGLGFATLGTAAGAVGVVLVWVLKQRLDGDPDASRAWELAACCVALVIVQHVHVELVARARRRAGEAVDAPELGLASAYVLAFGGAAAILVALVVNDTIGFAPWFAALACLALVSTRQSALSGRAWLTWAPAIPLGFATFLWTGRSGHRPPYVDVTTRTLHGEPGVWILGATVLYFVVEWLRRNSPQRGAAAVAQAIVLALGLCALDVAAAPLAGEPTTIVLAGLALLGLVFTSTASRVPSTTWLAAGALLTAFVQSSVVPLSPIAGALGLVLACAGVAGFVARGWFDTHGVARVRAVAPLLWFFPLRAVWTAWQHGEWRGAPAAILALVAFAAWTWTSRGARVLEVRTERGFLARIADGVRKHFAGVAPKTDAPEFDRPIDTARAWYHAVALSLALAVLPLQLDEQWPLVALALSAGALAWIARREKRVTFAVASAALLIVATVGSYAVRLERTLPVHAHAFWNLLAWLYLVPAAGAVYASLASNGLAATLDSKRAQIVRWSASVCGIAAVVLVFAWLNLAIRDAFGTSPTFSWTRERLPARDLTLSLAWALYALALLVLGVSRRSSGLRWISLILFLVAIVKVFMFDLGHLQGLHRVAALVGLAITLLGVSVLYQRFVFRRTSETGAPPAS